MTNEQIDALEAGPEMDELVSAALPETITEPYAGPAWVRWSPSQDWNCAMFAAEQFGLFHRPDKHVDNVLGVPGEGVWMISEWDDPMDHYSGIATAPTGPLAICRAILKLSQSGRSAS